MRDVRRGFRSVCMDWFGSSCFCYWMWKNVFWGVVTFRMRGTWDRFEFYV